MDSKKRIFKAGSMSLILIFLVLAVAVMLNMIMSTLPTSYTKIDLSEKNLYTLSQQTKELAAGLEEDVTLTLVAPSGEEDPSILELLNRYAALSSHLKVKTVDPVLYPYYTKQFTEDDVYTNSVVVEGTKRSKLLSYYDIYRMSYNADYSVHTDFAGESEITGAIDYVISDRVPVIHLLQGHGESALSEGLKTAIESNNMALETISLLTVEAVPEEVECLVVCRPTADLSEAEAKMLGSYLRNGGKMMLLTDYIDAEMPNLMGLLEPYGLYEQKGIIIEGDSTYCLSQYPHYLLPEIVRHTITAPLLEGSYFILAPFSHGIGIDNAALSDEYTVTTLLKTSDSAKIATPQEGTDGQYTYTVNEELSGPFNVGVSVERTTSEKKTQIVWFSTGYLMDDTVSAMVSGSNYDLLLNSLSWMVSLEDRITIHVKDLDTEYLTANSFDVTLWSTILIIIIPLCLLIVGGVIWYRRKKR